jgi:hypothetical protein
VNGVATIGAVGGNGNTTSTITGRVGPGVAAVDVVFSSGSRVRATTANGWFVAWWPSGDGHVTVQGLDANGQPLGAPHP